MDTAITVTDRLAPEHLEVQVTDADLVWKRISNYGAMFIGQGSAEVFGDYGAGPNHVLPTSGTARYTGGLSVFTFLVCSIFDALFFPSAHSQYLRVHYLLKCIAAYSHVAAIRWNRSVRRRT
jgi:histidinol dehydrogenase